jgi:hypothetical protein
MNDTALTVLSWSGVLLALIGLGYNVYTTGYNKGVRHTRDTKYPK